MNTFIGIFSFGVKPKLLHDNDRLPVVSDVWRINL